MCVTVSARGQYMFVPIFVCTRLPVSDDMTRTHTPDDDVFCYSYVGGLHKDLR